MSQVHQFSYSIIRDVCFCLKVGQIVTKWDFLTLCTRSDEGIVDLFALFRQSNDAIFDFQGFLLRISLLFFTLITKSR